MFQETTQTRIPGRWFTSASNRKHDVQWIEYNPIIFSIIRSYTKHDRDQSFVEIAYAPSILAFNTQAYFYAYGPRETRRSLPCPRDLLLSEDRSLHANLFPNASSRKRLADLGDKPVNHLSVLRQRIIDWMEFHNLKNFSKSAKTGTAFTILQ